MDVGGSNRHAANGARLPRRTAEKQVGLRAGARNVHSVVGNVERFEFTFPSDYARGHEAQIAILDSAERHGFAGDDFFALRIALEEALVNAIKHGNQLDASKSVKVKARISQRRIEIVVDDEGPGFDRSMVPDPTMDENLHKCSGRGILLIEEFMNQVKWERGGRRVRMVRVNHR